MINKYPNVCSDKFKIVALDFDGTVTEEGNFPVVADLYIDDRSLNCDNLNVLKILDILDPIGKSMY